MNLSTIFPGIQIYFTGLEKFIGILSSVTMILIFYWCSRIDGNFNYRKDAISYFGTSKKTAFLFNTTLLIISLFRIYYVYVLIRHLSLQDNWLTNYLVVIPLASMFLLGFLPSHRYKLLHSFLGYLMFFVSIIWLYTLYLSLWPENMLISMIGLAISSVLTVGTFWFYKKSNIFITEAFFLLMTIIWDLFNLYILFFVLI